MIAAFLAGWICCAAFIIGGHSIHAAYKRRRRDFATTSQFLTDVDDEIAALEVQTRPVDLCTRGAA